MENKKLEKFDKFRKSMEKKYGSDIHVRMLIEENTGNLILVLLKRRVL